MRPQHRIEWPSERVAMLAEYRELAANPVSRRCATAHTACTKREQVTGIGVLGNLAQRDSLATAPNQKRWTRLLKRERRDVCACG